MALKWMDGFELYSAATDINKKYAAGFIGQSTLDAGRSSYGQCFTFGFQGTDFVTPSLGDHATWTIGFGFKTNVNSDFTLLELRDGSTSQVELKLDGASTRLFRVTRGATTLGTGTTVINNNIWYYIELKVVVNNTTGTVELRINETADIGPLSSQNTRQSANNQANRVAFKRTAVSAGVLLFRSDLYSIDDLYICDGSGSANTTFLGDMKVETVTVNGEGNTTDWTPSSGTNWEAVADDDDLYVSSSTVDHKDTYVTSNLALVSTDIAAVVVNVGCRNTNATSHTIKSVVRSNGADTDAAAAKTIADIHYLYKSFVHEIDPDTEEAWTAEGVNAAEFGIKLIS